MSIEIENPPSCPYDRGFAYVLVKTTASRTCHHRSRQGGRSPTTRNPRLRRFPLHTHKRHAVPPFAGLGQDGVRVPSAQRRSRAINQSPSSKHSLNCIWRSRHLRGTCSAILPSSRLVAIACHWIVNARCCTYSPARYECAGFPASILVNSINHRASRVDSTLPPPYLHRWYSLPPCLSQSRTTIHGGFQYCPSWHDPMVFQSRGYPTGGTRQHT